MRENSLQGLGNGLGSCLDGGILPWCYKLLPTTFILWLFLFLRLPPFMISSPSLSFSTITPKGFEGFELRITSLNNASYWEGMYPISRYVRAFSIPSRSTSPSSTSLALPYTYISSSSPYSSTLFWNYSSVFTSFHVLSLSSSSSYLLSTSFSYTS